MTKIKPTLLITELDEGFEGLSKSLVNVTIDKETVG